MKIKCTVCGYEGERSKMILWSNREEQKAAHESCLPPGMYWTDEVDTVEGLSVKVHGLTKDLNELKGQLARAPRKGWFR